MCLKSVTLRNSRRSAQQGGNTQRHHLQVWDKFDLCGEKKWIGINTGDYSGIQSSHSGGITQWTADTLVSEWVRRRQTDMRGLAGSQIWTSMIQSVDNNQSVRHRIMIQLTIQHSIQKPDTCYHTMETADFIGGFKRFFSDLSLRVLLYQDKIIPNTRPQWNCLSDLGLSYYICWLPHLSGITLFKVYSSRQNIIFQTLDEKSKGWPRLSSSQGSLKCDKEI